MDEYCQAVRQCLAELGISALTSDEAALRLWLLQNSRLRRGALGSVSLGAVLVLVAGSNLGVRIAWPLLWSLVLLCAFGLRWVINNRPGAVHA